MTVRRLIALLAVALPLAFAASAHAYVYWGDYQGGTIGRANLDGTAVEDSFIQVGGHPAAVAVTPSYIYWANEAGGAIGRANIDGTGVEPNFITGINKPKGVAVSPSFVYWSSFGGNKIGRANLDGSGKNLGLISAAAPCSISIDSGHVYWGTALLTGYVGRASLTGSSAEPEWVNLGTYTPCGLAVNSANVFVADTGAFGPAHEIGRITIANKNFDPSMIGEAEGPCGLAVLGTRMFWANTGTDTIGVANTDATGVDENLVQTGGHEICGVAVDSLASPLTPPPSGEPGPGSGAGSGSGSGASPSPTPPPPTPGNIRVLKVANDKKHGTARISLTTNEAGAVSVTGKGLAAAKASASGAETVVVTVKTNRAKRATLKATGKLATKVAVNFAPSNGGTAARIERSLTLRRISPVS